MSQYTSEFFGLRIDIPDSWELVSWRHSNIDRSSRALYQSRDDDLPQRVGTSKFLFTANRYAAKSKAIVNAGIELSAYLFSETESLWDTLRANLAREGRTGGPDQTWVIDGIEFSYLDQAVATSAGPGAIRFVCRRISPTLWLYGKIAGYSAESFAEAVGIFQGLSWIPPGQRN